MLDNNITKKSDLPADMQTKKFNQKPVPSKMENKLLYSDFTLMIITLFQIGHFSH